MRSVNCKTTGKKMGQTTSHVKSKNGNWRIVRRMPPVVPWRLGNESNNLIG